MCAAMLAKLIRETQTQAHLEIQWFASEARRVVRAAADMFLQGPALPAFAP